MQQVPHFCFKIHFMFFSARFYRFNFSLFLVVRLPAPNPPLAPMVTRLCRNTKIFFASFVVGAENTKKFFLWKKRFFSELWKR